MWSLVHICDQNDDQSSFILQHLVFFFLFTTVKRLHHLPPLCPVIFKVSRRHLDVLILAFAPCTVTLTHPEDLLDQCEITHDVSRCLALLWFPLSVERWTSAEIREPRWDSQWKLNKNAVTKR